VTVTEGIKGSLRKGRGAEQAAAAHLAPLLCVQLGAGSLSDEVTASLGPILLQVTNDKSCAPLARAKVFILPCTLTEVKNCIYLQGL
jgi:hypothetical protein